MKKYYKRINNLDIQLCETNHKYLMNYLKIMNVSKMIVRNTKK